jgi:hypothetical protein
MRPSALFPTFPTLLLLLTALPNAVAAQPAQPPATKPAPTQPAEAGPVAPKEEPWKMVAFSTNPLNLLIGHYGLNVEFLPFRHHGFIASPHYDHVNGTVSTTDIVDNAPVTYTYNNRYSGLGVELGYRFYTGSSGPTGFFMGPSFLLASYKSSGDPLGRSVSQSFGSLGYAFDVGGQAVVAGGLVIGGGFGMQYTHLSKDLGFTDLPITASIIAGGGWRPRFLMSIGYAF